MGAKVGLLFGLVFYVTVYFVFALDIHFVHVWGIEFVLNMLVMFSVSRIQKFKGDFKIADRQVVDLDEWEYRYVLGGSLILATLILYLIFGHVA